MRLLVTREHSEDYDYESLEIVIDGKSKFKVSNSADAMEDATLSRDFEDCHNIPALLRKAFEAGKNGEDFEIEYIEDEVE